MKKSIHPPYQEVLFIDSSTGKKFIIASTMQPKETEMFEGKEYPVFRVPVSSASHPFYTGSTRFVDSEGRVSRFARRYAQKREQEKKNKEQSDQALKDKKTKTKKKK